MVHDAADVPEGPVNLDSVRVVFNEERLVSDAGLLVTATLAARLGIEGLVNESVWLDSRAPGACLPGRKVLSLVHGMLAGADSIDDMNVLRAGATGLILGHRVMASSTLGTFLRAFTFGHVRQLDSVFAADLAGYRRIYDEHLGAPTLSRARSCISGLRWPLLGCWDRDREPHASSAMYPASRSSRSLSRW